MKYYLKLYRWSMQMKLRMGLYALGLLFCKMIWNWSQGVVTVRSLEIVTIWAACLIFAMLETVLLPAGREHSALQVAVWACAANLIFIGGALLAGWFRGINAAGAVLLIALLELFAAMMWFGDHVAMRADSLELNRQLKEYQRRNERGE